MVENIHPYLSGALAVVVGAVAAGTYTAYLNHLSSKNDIIKDYLADLREIEKLSKEYWLFESAYTCEKREHENLGHELRARLEATSNFSSLSKSILDEKYEVFDDLDVQLFITATGGNFQTQKFSRCPETYGKVMSIISDMKRLLREKRNAMFWVR